MGGLSKVTGGIGQGEGSSLGNAGPATSGTGGLNFGNFSSGGGFDPFATKKQPSLLASPVVLVAAGAGLVLLLMKMKK